MNRKQRRAAASPDKRSANRPALHEPHGSLMSIAERFKIAYAYHQAGRLREAQQLYQQICTLDPNHVDSLHYLGMLRYHLGDHSAAIELIGRALALAPDHALAHYNLGLVLMDQGRQAEAVAHYEGALALGLELAEVHNNLGIALVQQGKQAEAIAHYERALALKPDHAGVHNNLGAALVEQGRFAEAMACYERTLALKPNYAEAWLGRASALRELKRVDEAIAAYDRALAINPDLAEGWLGLGNILWELKRLGEAIAAYDKALTLKPDYPEAWLGRAGVFWELKRLDEAFAAYDRALAINPDLAEVWQGLGNTLLELKRPVEAIAAYDKALALKPQMKYALGSRLYAKLHICDWSDLDSECSRFLSAVRQEKRPSPPFTLLAVASSPEDQLKCAQILLKDRMIACDGPLRRGERPPHDRIRIVYLSADFRQHVVATVLAELLELHDRSRFEVLGVSFGPDDNSELRARIVKAFDRFHDGRFDGDRQIAEFLHDAEVDIAVDLMGHTERARLGVLAHRPAPIQVSYLGYPATTGADFLDYVIGDPIVLPFDQQPFFAEKIVHLPDCYLPSDSQQRQIADRVAARNELGLPEDGFVFCAFTQTYKIAPPMFDVWMRLLRAVEGSVLWLSQSSDLGTANLRREAQARSVDPARLIFAPWCERLADHLARQQQADLYLDTLPYNAHTTASNALWAGLPVLTCRGNTFASRVGASALSAAGLPELITDSLEEYETLAVKLATEPELRRSLRGKLDKNRGTCPLFDTDRFRRHIEAAYTTMWEIHRRGQPPRSFRVEPT